MAEDPNASGDEAITALVRLGWMAYAGNGEVETATRLIDEALAIDPESSVARYVRARVVWCGTGDTEQAIETFDDLLADPGLAAETQAQIQTDLEVARAGVNVRDREGLALDRSGHRRCHGGPRRGPGQPFRKRSRPGRLPLIGKPAPEFTLAGLDGSEGASLSDLRGDIVVVTSSPLVPRVSK